MTDKRISIRLAMDGKSEFKRDVSELETQAKASFGNVKGSIDGATASTDDLVAALKRASAEESAALSNSSRTSTAKGQAAARDLIGIDPTSAAKAKASAAAINAELKTMDRQAQAVRYSLDPLAMATDRYASAEATLDKLLKNGKITLDQHGAALKNEKAALDVMTEAHNKGAKAVGLSSSAIRMMAVSTLPDLAQGLLAGQFSFASFVNQAGQAVQIAGMQPGGFGAALRSTTALFNPYTLAIGAAVAVTGTAIVATYNYANAQDTLALSLKGIGGASGASVAQLQQLAEQHAKTADIGVAAARDQENAYLHAGVTNTDVIGKLIDISRDYALVTNQDLKGATDSLSKGMTDTTGAGLELLRSLGQLDDKTRAYIISLEARGEHEEAQATILGKVAIAVDGASKHVNTLAEAWHGVATAAGDAFDAMGKAVNRDVAQDPQSIIDRYNRQKTVTGNLGQNLNPLVGSLFNRHVTQSDYQAALREQTQAQTEAAAKAAQKKADDTSIAAGNALKTLDPFTGKRKEIDDQVAAVQAQYDLVKAAVTGGTKQQADLVKAQADLDRANAGRKRQLEALDKSENPKAPGANRAASLAREAESVKVNTEATLDLAEAYLKSNDAALKAEASRKAMTDATRRGTDVAAAVQRQLDLTVAQAVVNGAKAVASSRDQAAAQKAVNDQVAAGMIPAHDAQQAMQQEAALRPLLAAQAIAHGRALEDLNKVIGALKGSMQDLNNEQQRANLLAASEANADQLAYLDKQLELIGQTNAARGVALAQFQTAQTIGKNSAVDPDNPDDAFAAAVDLGIKSDKVANGKAKVDAGTYTDQVVKDQDRQNQLAKLELSMLGQKQSAIDKAMALKEAELDIDRASADLTKEQRDAILGAVAARENENAVLERGKAIQGEIRGVQDQIGDRLQQYLMDGKISWKSLGDVAGNVLNDIMAEVVKLTVINPFKNWAFGQDNATLGSNSGIASIISSIFSIGGHASGTESAMAGYAWVGEQGPELMKMRAGDVIKSNPVSNAMTRSALAQQPRQQPVNIQQHFHMHAEGAVVTEQLINGLNKQAQGYATQAAKRAYEEAVKTSASSLKGNISAINRRKAL